MHYLLGSPLTIYFDPSFVHSFVLYPPPVGAIHRIWGRTTAVFFLDEPYKKLPAERFFGFWPQIRLVASFEGFKAFIGCVCYNVWRPGLGFQVGRSRESPFRIASWPRKVTQRPQLLSLLIRKRFRKNYINFIVLRFLPFPQIPKALMWKS